MSKEAASNPISALHSLGQSLWYDNIQRSLLRDGTLEAMIQRDEIRGMTSNPSIFEKAISQTNEYDLDISHLANEGYTAEEIYEHLTVEDVQAAADLFHPLYARTNAVDGYVSLEVNPHLAYDTQGTVIEAQRLWDLVDRPNLMIKIPATTTGLPAITASIVQGININVTLLFSLERYSEVMDAYLTGLEQRLEVAKSLQSVTSVASFFVSRIDTKADARLGEVICSGHSRASVASDLVGKIAVSSARLAYQRFIRVFEGSRFKKLQSRGGCIQRPLWASTSTKNPAYSDVKYVEDLIGPGTINTVPPHTLEAFRHHGRARLSITENVEAAQQVLDQFESIGVSPNQITKELEQEGVEAFASAFDSLIASIENRRKQTLRM
ncbi:MAG: transaldolase [Chloroflexota bacterium]